MQSPRFFWYEEPNTLKNIQIDLEEVEEIASSYEDFRAAEEMDDDDFYFYVHVLLNKDA